MFPGPGDAYHPVNGTSAIAQGEAGVLRPFSSLWPMVGVGFYEGKHVLVVGPWFMNFDQLSSHGYLSEEEVKRLLAAAQKIDRELYRVIRRKSQIARNAAALASVGANLHTGKATAQQIARAVATEMDRRESRRRVSKLTDVK